jgi:hypothetical protein
MVSTASSRISFEPLEGRTLMSVAPLTVPKLNASAQQAVPAVATPAVKQTLASYIAGTWVTTIGNTLYYRFVFSSKKRTYVTQEARKVYVDGVAHLTAWTTLVHGSWKIVDSVVEATTATGPSFIHVYKYSNKLAEFDVVSPKKTPPLRAVFARVV